MNQQESVSEGEPVVTIYTTGLCGYCHMAKGLLQRQGISYREIPVDRDSAQRSIMAARSGRQTVPQIFFGEHHIGGCDDLMALVSSGGLDELLQKEEC